MEVTTSAEALRRQRAALGGSATTRACARLTDEGQPVEAPLGEIAVFVAPAGWHRKRSYVLEEQAAVAGKPSARCIRLEPSR